MKHHLILIALLSIQLTHAQEKPIQKPSYVVIINDEISSREKIDAYASQGYVKKMTKGVSEEERNRLAEKFGDQIGDKEFIVLVSLFTEAEMSERKNNINVPVSARNEAEHSDILKINNAATDFTVTMIDGKEVTLSELKGKVVLLNFWATWCAPCLMEFYEIPSKILEPFKDSEFVFLPISKGESLEKVTSKMSRLKKDGIDFNAGIDPDKQISNRYAAGAIPKNVLIDKDGIIRYISTGYGEGSLDKLAVEIDNLLNKSDD